MRDMLFMNNLSKPLSKRNGKSILYRPIQGVNPLNYLAGRYFYQFRPFRNTDPFSSELNKTVLSSVSCLFFQGSPATVFSAVMSVVINSFDRGVFFTISRGMFQIRFVHVLFERLKRQPKTFNSSSVIIRSPSASSDYASVDSIKPVGLSSSVKSVFKVASVAFLKHKAPTRSSVSTREVSSSNSSFFSAIADTVPNYITSSSFFGRGDNYNSSESLSFKVSNLLTRNEIFKAVRIRLCSSHSLLRLKPTRFASRSASGAAKLVMAI